MTEVCFYDNADDNLLKFAVIVSKYKDKFVFCKHIERDTYEIPGGRREEGESIFETAKRELWEETGATEYTLKPVSVYSVIRNESADYDAEIFGMLYYADIKAFENLPDLEIEKIEFFENLPKNLTYPDIQPRLMEKAIEALNNKYI